MNASIPGDYDHTVKQSKVGEYRALSEKEFRAVTLLQGCDLGSLEISRSRHSAQPAKYLGNDGEIGNHATEGARFFRRDLYDDVLLETDYVDLGMIGRSPAFRTMTMRIRDIIRDGNDTAKEVPNVILVTGETGTGKEAVVKALYLAGPRKTKPFAQIHLGAFSQNPDTFRAQAYGRTAGAFTSADRDSPGILSHVTGGVVQLDDIGVLWEKEPDQKVQEIIRFQSAFLELLEGKAIYPVGAAFSFSPDVRFILTSNADPEEALRQGNLRPDLFQRLGQVRIHVPSLMERREDVPLLAEYYARYYSDMLGKRVELTDKEIDMMVDYAWPGNVRELQRVILERMTTKKMVLGMHKPASVRSDYEPLKNALSRMFAAGLSLDQEDFERTVITTALEYSNWVQRDAAEIIGISRRVMYYKVRTLGIEIPESAPYYYRSSRAKRPETSGNSDNKPDASPPITNPETTKAPHAKSAGNHNGSVNLVGQGVTVREIEDFRDGMIKDLLTEALGKTGGDVAEAAGIVGINTRQARQYIGRYKIKLRK